MSFQTEHIKALKQRIAEIKSLLAKHVKLLEICNLLLHQFKRETEQLRIDRLNTLQRTRIEPEDEPEDEKLHDQAKHVKELKERIAEIVSLLDNHIALLNKCKILLPQFEGKFENLRLDYVNKMERAQMDPEDY